MGSLEQKVLSALWAAEHGLTPAQVLATIGDDLAYTTVMTILTRLWKKDLLERTRRGRAFVYRPIVSEAEYAATRMQAQLERVSDRGAALSRFVGSLTPKDERMLRRALGEAEDS